MPKLKVGDTFVYTKEMNEAKIKSRFSYDAGHLVGHKLRVGGMDDISYKGDQTRFWFDFNVIDDFLPPKTPSKKAPRTWTTDVTSSDGIIVTSDSITIDGVKKSPSEWNEYKNTIRAALKKHKDTFNS